MGEFDSWTIQISQRLCLASVFWPPCLQYVGSSGASRTPPLRRGNLRTHSRKETVLSKPLRSGSFFHAALIVLREEPSVRDRALTNSARLCQPARGWNPLNLTQRS